MKRRKQLALKSIKTNPKYFFSYARKFSKTHTKIGPHNYTNSYPYKQYSSVFTKSSDNPYNTCKERNDIPSLYEIHFIKTDIEDAIDKLLNTAASGPSYDVWRGTLFQLWRDCIDQGIAPESQRSSHNSHPQGGQQGLASNYRPIALTSHIIKVFEKVVRNY